MNRRRFLGVLGLGLSQGLAPSGLRAALKLDAEAPHGDVPPGRGPAFGSGHFGEWITDPFGLPAYRYTCDQATDPRAISPVHPFWRSPTDHTHQVGNDRVIAAVSNYGHVQVRQDEGSPKFLNDYCPERGLYGAGVGYLADGAASLATCGHAFERVFGEGYYRKIVRNDRYQVDQVIFAPFGDDPVLVSMVTITNHSDQAVAPRWVEYWGCQNYQFSYRAWMQQTALNTVRAADMRRSFAERFEHRFAPLGGGRGLWESQRFLGRSADDERLWKEVEAYLEKHPEGDLGGPLPAPARGTAMDDLEPPATFLASMDGPVDALSTDAGAFFGTDGKPATMPAGLAEPLDGNLGSTGARSAFLLERRVALRPRSSRTFGFVYGYAPDGFEIEALVAKYSGDPKALWARSSAAWKMQGVRFRTPGDPWVERETSWHSYYLRSALTYDGFFREHILSQGHVYQYIVGFQGAARDPLQHALPFVFSDPAIARGVVRYTLKEIQPDGSIPYGLVGRGLPMPGIYHPSDLEMWLLWLASEYVLASRDLAFLDERIPPYPRPEAASGDPTVGDLLGRSFAHLVDVIGVGEHGIARLSNGDWNDEVVVAHVPPEKHGEIRSKGESVLNGAMAGYVLDLYGEMLDYAGDATAASAARVRAEAQRRAVRAQWTGQWYRRAWLGPSLGWIGEDHLWLEPQPWAIIGGAATGEQSRALVATLDAQVRRPSPIGALVQSKGDTTIGTPCGTMTNGGVWPSINGTLIWALARVDGAQAWDEWKKNSLAAHAEAYPDIWYGIWSGPDTYDSVLSRHPGQTMFAEEPVKGRQTQEDWGVSWTDYPVMNLHPHAWPLYSAAKLLGVAFHRGGVSFRPTLPLDAYEFSSSLLGLKADGAGYSGWYAPVGTGRWEVSLTLPSKRAADLTRLSVNGRSQEPGRDGEAIRFSGESAPGQPLRWELT
ncbi:MAG TPA: hypothetical protein VGF85_01600 [Opitutaceae bacterium]|jgi:hypothetical protein